MASCLVLLMLLSACAHPTADIPPGSHSIDLDKSGEAHLIGYWLSAYLDPPGDPFEAGVVFESDGSFFLAARDSMQYKAPDLMPLLAHETVDWAVFSAFITETWHDAVGHPQSIGEWVELDGNWRDAEGWMRIPVKGSMSPYERVVHVRESSVRAAIAKRAQSGELIYPLGTLFVAEHVEGDVVMETTIMWKRQQDAWDYVSYDADGQRTDRIFKEPEPLLSPVQCQGCHEGNRGFEPERSFPRQVDAGPDGERYIGVDEASRDPVVTSALNEHMRRSDTILGLYATVYLSRVRTRVLSGSGSASDSLLLREQDIPIDNQAS